jgi:guanylate kinase
LEHRLRGRGTEAESVIQKRTEAAVAEMKCATNYDYLVVNGTLEDAVAEMKQIISAERIRHIEKEEKVREVLES